MKFWDASAVVPLLVNEVATPSMKSLTLVDPGVAVWWATGTECVSAITRRLRMVQINKSVHDVALARLVASRGQWTVVPPTENLRDTAEQMLTKYPLRAADALQLAAALSAAAGAPSPLAFVCLDERLRDAARSEGFIVEP